MEKLGRRPIELCQKAVVVCVRDPKQEVTAGESRPTKAPGEYAATREDKSKQERLLVG